MNICWPVVGFVAFVVVLLLIGFMLGALWAEYENSSRARKGRHRD